MCNRYSSTINSCVPLIIGYIFAKNVIIHRHNIQDIELQKMCFSVINAFQHMGK